MNGSELFEILNQTETILHPVKKPLTLLGFQLKSAFAIAGVFFAIGTAM